MDCYDEILKLYHEKDRIDKCLKYLTDLINKKSKFLTDLQFKNSLILILVIWSPNFIDTYFSKGKEIGELDKDKKEMMLELLKSEFTGFDS